MIDKTPHPHAEIIKQWADNPKIKIIGRGHSDFSAFPVEIENVTSDVDGKFIFKIETTDPYEHLRKAEKEGKRIVWQHSNGEWIENKKDEELLFCQPPEQYKIVDNDSGWSVLRLDVTTRSPFPIKIEITKSGIDGALTAKVVEHD